MTPAGSASGGARLTIRRVAVFSNSPPDDALYTWRIAGPLRHAGVEITLGATASDLHLDAVEQADAILVQRDYPGRITDYQRVLDRARSRSIPVLFEVDDLLFELPADHPDRQSHYYAPSLLPAFRALIEADLVITSTDPLRLRLARFNPNTIVFPNRLDEALWPGPPARSAVHGTSLGIGYFGTSTHAPDVEIVAAPLRAVLDRFGERVAIRFFGCPPPHSLREDPRVAWIPLAGGLLYRDYVELLREAPVDIGIAPLADTDFNRAKSEAKFLEYSAAGIPGVYSDVGPYHAVVRPGRTGWLARCEQDWVEHLARMIEDGSLRERMAQSAYDEVHSRWSLSACRENWRATVERALHTRQPAEAGQADRVELVRRLTEQVATWTSSLEAEVIAQRTEAERQAQEATASGERVRAEQVQLQAAQEEHARRIRALQETLDQQRSAAEALTEELETRRAEREELGRAIEGLHAEIARGKHALNDARGQMAEREREAQELGAQLANMASSKAWRVAIQLEQLRRRLAPPGSRRARLAKAILLPIMHALGTVGPWGSQGRDLALIRSSDLFDEEWYLSRSPDVAEARVDPARHYLIYGGFEGRDPGPHFQSRWYLRTYSDVARAHINPLVHYLRFGRQEGRLPSDTQHPGDPAGPSG